MLAEQGEESLRGSTLGNKNRLWKEFFKESYEGLSGADLSEIVKISFQIQEIAIIKILSRKGKVTAKIKVQRADLYF